MKKIMFIIQFLHSNYDTIWEVLKYIFYNLMYSANKYSWKL